MTSCNTFRVILLGLALFSSDAIAQSQSGIYVGRPKVFDNRTLSIMLEDLSGQLARITAVDQAQLAAAAGKLQGIEMRESAVAGSVGIARPYTTTKVESDKTTKTETVPEIKFSDSGIGTAQTLPIGTPTFGLAAQDILSDQVNLQYQIFNLRMIMDRSLTDRIHGNQSKLQAVLGIPVSLDPSRHALDSAAIVKVTVTMETSKIPVSVVALMPQEKTYNSATLSKSSAAFAGTAVAKVVQVGFSATKRGQTYFLYRDNDTISFEHPGAPENETVFGWQFRPVLGRRSVAPGMRQMFAVVALPTADNGTTSARLSVKVETRWVKYQRSQLTTFPTTLWYETLGGLIGKPSTPPEPDRAPLSFEVEVPTTEGFQSKLKPTVTDVGYTAVGMKTVVVAVNGTNFLSDTKVIMGGKTYDTSNGLKIKSEQAFDLVVDSSALSDAVIQGRYGNAVPLIRPLDASDQLKIDRIDWAPPIGGSSIASIILTRNSGLRKADLPKFDKLGTGPPLSPLIALAGTPLGAASLQDLPGKKDTKDSVRATFSVPADLAKKSEGRLTFYFPFLGSQWSASEEIRDKNKVYTCARLKNSATATDWTFLVVTDSQGMLDRTDDLRVVIPVSESIKLEKEGQGNCTPFDHQKSKSAFCWQDEQTAILRINSKEIGDELLITRGGVFARMAVPPLEKKPEAAKKNPEVSQYDSVWLTLDLDFSKVETVKADGETQAIRKNGEKTDVLITRKLTQKPGSVDLIAYAPAETGKPGAEQVIRIEIVCKECQSKENKH